MLSSSSSSVINHYSLFARAKNEIAEHYNTIFNALVNGVGSLISIMYFLAQTSDLIDGLDGEGDDDFVADMSIIGFPIGLGLGLIITLVSIYPHYVLNIDSFDSLVRNWLPSSLPEINIPESDSRFDLSWKQKLSLFLDFFSHTADSTAPALFIFDYWEKDPTREAKIFAQIIATAIGMYSAYKTDLVTCRRNIRLHNKKVFLDSLNPEETLASIHARFLAQECGKLKKFHAKNPQASAFFENIGTQCDERAEQFEVTEKPLLLRRSIKAASKKKDNDEEHHYHLLAGDQDDIPQASIKIGPA